MKCLFIFLVFIFSTNIFALKAQVVSQEGIDLITLGELKIVKARFDKYLRCSREKVSRCNAPDDKFIPGFGFPEVHKSDNSPTYADEHYQALSVCSLPWKQKIDEDGPEQKDKNYPSDCIHSNCSIKHYQTVNSFGVTDQSACLMKHQEIKDLLFSKQVESFLLENLGFTERRFLPKDFFEILDKYPKVINVNKIAFLASGAISAAYAANYECASLGLYCSRLVNEHHYLVNEDIRHNCQSPNKPDLHPFNAGVDDLFYLQPDDEAAIQCSAFFKELTARGFNQMVNEGFPKLSGEILKNYGDSEYDYYIGHSKSLKEDFEKRIKQDPEELKHLFNFYKSAFTEENNKIQDYPWGMIQVNTIKLLQELLRSADPTFDTKLPPKLLSYEENHFSSILPKKNWIPKSAPITIPVVGNYNDNGSLQFRGGDDFISPGAACGVPPPGLQGYKDSLKDVCRLIYPLYKNGKPINPYWGELILLPNLYVLVPAIQAQPKTAKESPDKSTPASSSSTKSTSKASAKITNNELYALAQYQSKLEISNEFNCSDNKDSKNCKNENENLTSTIPKKLDSLCGADSACLDNYKSLQAYSKNQMLLTLPPDIATLKIDGVYLEPFKVSRVMKEARGEMVSQEKIFKPFLMKTVSRWALNKAAIGLDLDKITKKVCDKAEQLEAGGDFNKCLNLAKKIVENAKSPKSSGQSSGRLTGRSSAQSSGQYSRPSQEASDSIDKIAVLSPSFNPQGTSPYLGNMDHSSEKQIRNEVSGNSTSRPSHLQNDLNPKLSQESPKALKVAPAAPAAVVLASGLTQEETEDMLKNYNKNKEKYKSDEEDSIFQKVSKAYTRSFEKILVNPE